MANSKTSVTAVVSLFLSLHVLFVNLFSTILYLFLNFPTVHKIIIQKFGSTI